MDGLYFHKNNLINKYITQLQHFTKVAISLIQDKVNRMKGRKG